jgi:hypothetical protein
MQPEETLDLLLTERNQRGAVAALPREYRQASAELAPLLAAAARLDGLRDARPSADFADDLERRLMERMVGMEQTSPTVSVGATVGMQPAPRTPARAKKVTHAPRIPARLAWISVAAALALTIGLGVFTAQAAPGGPLYPIREFAKHVAGQAFPSSTATAQAALARASVDLANYQSAIAHGDTPAALAALSALRSDDAQAAQDIAALQDGSARNAMQERLAQFRQGAAADLHASLAALDWRARAQVTDALRAWGDATLRVTQARLLAASSSGQDQHTKDGSGDALLTVSGAGFTPGAQILVNGQAVGEVIALTPAQIKARVSASAVTGSALVVGVEISDGEVATTTDVQQDDHGSVSHAPTPGSEGSSHGSGDGSTPSPTETRGVGLGG